MATDLNSVISEALDDRDIVAELAGNLDDELRDFAEWAGTYDADALVDKAMEYVDGTAPTIYDDDALETCRGDESLADEMARSMMDADGWRSLPVDRLTVLAAFVLECELSQLVAHYRDELYQVAAAAEFIDDVSCDRWDLSSVGAGEDEAKAVADDVAAALADGDADAARAVMENAADAVDDEDRLDFAKYSEYR